MNLSTEQIALLRTRPHNTTLWLSIYQPDTKLACRLNNANAAKGDYFLPYDGITAGAYADVNPGMTLYAGYSAGAWDKGKVRVRSISSTGIIVAENAYIEWTDNDYLTIVDFYEINAVYPRIILNPNDTTTWYKDYDIVYTNQNSNLGFFPCMGGHYAGFLDGSSELVYYTASGTSSLQAGVTGSYHWLFEGGTPTGSNLHTPGWVTYTTPGHYTTSMIVSGSAVGEPSYRHISIYDRPENGTSNPILQWELLSLEGNRENSGYNARIRIFENVPETVVRDGALVVIFADDWYGYQKQSIGGSQPNRESIVFSGYILGGTVSYNYRDSYIEFDVGSPTEVMKLSEAFAVSITDCDDPVTAYTNDPNNPSPWMLLKDMDVKRSIYHYLKWHSTVLNCCDIQFLSSDNYMTGCDFDRSSLYDAINTLISSALFGRLTSDRQGKLWLEKELYIDPDYYEYSPLLIGKEDWMNTPTIEERQTDTTSYIEMGGVAYNSVTGTAVPLLSAAPGITPSYRGTVLRVQGLALASQGELNNICGYLYEYKNSRYPSLTYELAGNYRNIDIAPQQKYALTIDAADTVRGKTIQVATHVQNVSFVYDPADEALLTNVEFSQLPIRVLSSTTTGTYGAVSNYSGTAIVMPEFPPFPTLPPFPAFPIITGTSTTTAGVGYVFSLFTAGNDGSIDWVWSKSPPGVFLQDLVVTDADTAFLCPSDGLLNIYAVFKTREATGAGDVELDWQVLRTGINGDWGALNSASNSSDQLSILDSEDKVRWHFLCAMVVNAGDAISCNMIADRIDMNDSYGDSVWLWALAGEYV